MRASDSSSESFSERGRLNVTSTSGTSSASATLSPTLDLGLWTLDSGLWTLDSGLWTLDSGLWTLDLGLWTLDFVRQDEPCRAGIAVEAAVQELPGRFPAGRQVPGVFGAQPGALAVANHLGNFGQEEKGL